MPTVIGSRLRELRIAAGLTQADVAQELGLSKPRISQWETDNEIGIDSINRLRQLARALRVEVADLLVEPQFTPAARVQKRKRPTDGSAQEPLPIPSELLHRPPQAPGAVPLATQPAPEEPLPAHLEGLSPLQQAAVDALCKACRAGKVDDEQALALLNRWYGLLAPH